MRHVTKLKVQSSTVQHLRKTNRLRPSEVLRALMRLCYLNAKLQGVKQIYAEIDELTIQLIGAKLPKTISLGEQKVSVIMNDNFAEKNVVFRPVGVKRFEIKFETVEVASPKKRGKK